ncbi:MAG TPA: arginine--tRNA ligase [Candidatus Acidoferrum sp.]|nr:arginine--tRNA ligase [Candidatus Acidoferrum sp.]
MPDSPYAGLKAQLEESLAGAMSLCGYDPKQLENTVDISKGIGDFSCSVAFRISKEKKVNPKEIAASIAGKLKGSKMVKQVTVDNGYINFHIDRKEFSASAINYIIANRERLASTTLGNGKKIIVEYVSVNPVHPWHVGHLRNAILGDSVANIYSACGYRVERENYMDNLGLQAAEAVWGKIHSDQLKVQEGPEKKYDYSIGEIYVATNRLIAQKPEIAADVKRTLALMEQDGTYESKIAREMAESFLMAERETAFSYGIYQDVVIWEGDIVREHLLEKMLEILEKKKLTKKPSDGKYKGCVIIELADLKNIPKELTGLREDAKVLIRSDGSANYLAKDIAFHMWKLGLIRNNFLFDKFIEKQPDGKPLFTTSEKGEKKDFGGADMAITLTDTRQNFEQLLIKVIFNSIGEGEKANGLKHIGYGEVDLEGAKLSGRKGTWVGYTANDLLDEARGKVITAIKPNEEINDEERERIAEKVAIGAIKFEFLKISPERKIIFSWDRALSFEGNSGPYCQYTYARATRILDKSGMKEQRNASASDAFEEQNTFNLVKLMSGYQDVLEKACREDRPNVITDYLIELSSAFSKFYESVPILKDESTDKKAALLALVSAFRNVMKVMLGSLGIEAIERM